MITLKVLNSIVLLGTSCMFVKEANMEEKLFEPPPSAVSSRANSRAHRTKQVYTAPQQGDHTLHLCLCFKSLKCAYFSRVLNSTRSTESTSDKGGTSLASDNVPPANMAERPGATLPQSDSDTFLTTPDEDDDDKIINSDTGMEENGLKHRTPKKDLLEIDRFTICGNRID